jgi:hypothetical protein
MRGAKRRSSPDAYQIAGRHVDEDISVTGWRALDTRRFSWHSAVKPPANCRQVGLPPKRTNIYYAGVAWPLAWRRLQFSVGSPFGWNEVAKNYRVGQLVPFPTEREGLTEHEFKSQLTVGLTFDLLSAR